jgi:cell division protein WhiA
LNWREPTSLSEDLRNELATIQPLRECDLLAELSGLAHTAGTIHLLGRGRVALHLDLASSSAARRAFAIFRRLGVASEIRTYEQRAFGRPTRYQLHVSQSPRKLKVLTAAGILGRGLLPLTVPPRRVVGRRCCRGAYLRGALLGAGSLSGPRQPHLEVRSSTPDGARFIAGLAAQEDVELAVVDRARHSAAYAKAAETIAGALALAGASDLALQFEERAVVADTRSRANRLANADHANLVRTSRAAHLQLEAVHRLESEGRLAQLPEPLREAAGLRKRHPALPLRELAGRSSRPTSKAAMYRRLKKLVELAGG